MQKISNIKKITHNIHLWLGLISGIFVVFLGITGCILAFQKEIENTFQSYRYSPVEQNELLAPSILSKMAKTVLPGKKLHSIGYEPGKSCTAVFFDFAPNAHYFIVYLNPYSGKVLKIKDMSKDFFRIVINGHYYLWLPPNIGQPILTSATLIFVVLMITGLILWWPRHKAALKQRFSIKWNASWKRLNYDLHNVLGFYMTWIGLFLALTGMIMGFQWFAKSVYWVASGGQKNLVTFYEAHSDTSKIPLIKPIQAPEDHVWMMMRKEYPNFSGSMEVHPPEDHKSSLEVTLNPDTETYWKADYRYFDQYSFKELSVDHVFGRFQGASAADKLARMNFDIHVGAIAGLPGKTLAFLASLLAATLPITGFLLWRGRKNKKKSKRASVIVHRRTKANT